MGSSESKSEDQILLDDYLEHLEVDDHSVATEMANEATNWYWCDVTSGTTKWKDLIQPDMLDIVAEQWREYGPASHCLSIFLGFLYLIVVVSGCSGNLAVIWLFLRSKQLRTPANMLLVNLSLADSVLLGTGFMFVHNTFRCGPAWSVFACELYGFLGGVAGTASIMTITAMSVDRYMVISNPLKPKRLTKWMAVFVVLLIWTYALAFTILPFYRIFSRFAPEGFLTTCSFDYFAKELSSKVFFAVYFVASYWFPLMAIFMSYIGIFRSVAQSEKAFKKFKADTTGSVMKAGDKVSTVSESIKDKSLAKDKVKKQQSQEIKIAKVALALVSLWLIGWTPYAVIAMVCSFGDPTLITPAMAMLPAIFAKSSAIVNPFVYTLSHPAFRRELKAAMKSSKPGKRKIVPKDRDTVTICSDDE